MIPPPIASYVVRDTDTVKSAMATIEDNLHRSVVVVNESDVVVGMLSDGDIRKAILDGRLLTTPVHRVMNADFTALRPSETGRAQQIFTTTHIFLIPVIDEHGRLLDILTAY